MLRCNSLCPRSMHNQNIRGRFFSEVLTHLNSFPLTMRTYQWQDIFHAFFKSINAKWIQTALARIRTHLANFVFTASKCFTPLPSTHRLTNSPGSFEMRPLFAHESNNCALIKQTPFLRGLLIIALFSWCCVVKSRKWILRSVWGQLPCLFNHLLELGDNRQLLLSEYNSLALPNLIQKGRQ